MIFGPKNFKTSLQLEILCVRGWGLVSDQCEETQCESDQSITKAFNSTTISLP